MLSRSSEVKPKGKDCLLVVASPEDVLGLYYPTVENLISREVNVNVFALSAGPKPQPKDKIQEIYGKVKIKHWEVVEDSFLVFGQHWPHAAVARHVGRAMEKLRPDILITCDEEGLVPEMSNNKSVHAGVKALIVEQKSLAMQRAREGMLDDHCPPEIWCQKTIDARRRYSANQDSSLYLEDLFQKKPDHVVFAYSATRWVSRLLWKLSSMPWKAKLAWLMTSWYVYYNELNHVA